MSSLLCDCCFPPWLSQCRALLNLPPSARAVFQELFPSLSLSLLVESGVDVWCSLFSLLPPFLPLLHPTPLFSLPLSFSTSVHETRSYLELNSARLAGQWVPEISLPPPPPLCWVTVKHCCAWILFGSCGIWTQVFTLQQRLSESSALSHSGPFTNTFKNNQAMNHFGNMYGVWRFG